MVANTPRTTTSPLNTTRNTTPNTQGNPPSGIGSFLFKIAKKQKKWLIVAITCSVFFAAIQLLIGEVTKRFMDQAIAGKDASQAIKLSIALCGVILLEASLAFGQRFSTRIAAERAIRDLRQQVFDKLLVFSEANLSQYSAGKAVNRVVTDVHFVGVGFIQSSEMLRAPLVLIAIISYLVYLNWQLSLICLILFPALAFFGGLLAKSARRNQRRLQQSVEKISTHIAEAVNGLRTAHAFEQTPLLRQEFKDKTNESYKFLIKLARIEESVNPTTKFLGAIIGTTVIALAALMVSRGTMSAGDFTAFILMGARLIDPFRVFNDFHVRFQQMATAAERVREVLDEKLDPIGVSQEKRLQISTHAPSHLISIFEKGNILSFENVFFRYPGREELNPEPEESPNSNVSPQSANNPWTLNNIRLNLEVGKKIALVGRSGSGKSTLSLMALRMLDPIKGQITLRGKNALDWDIAEYRSYFSYVSQDAFLFHRSIRDNMLFSKPTARDPEVWMALEKTHVAEFVRALPKQLDTIVSFDGNDFSGGERQRLSLARAFLRDAPILILDEATSHLDAFSEAAVQSAIKELLGSRSVIVIAHRLSTIREMDEVLVFEQGQIIQRGVPSTLLNEKSGPFYELWSQQNSSLSKTP